MCTIALFWEKNVENDNHLYYIIELLDSHERRYYIENNMSLLWINSTLHLVSDHISTLRQIDAKERG